MNGDDDDVNNEYSYVPAQEEDDVLPAQAQLTQGNELPPFVQQASRQQASQGELPPFVRQGGRQTPQDKELPPFVQQAQQKQPEAEPAPESQLMSGVRAFAKSVVPTTAGVLGAVAAAPFGAPAGPVGMVGTALAGGVAASAATQKAQDWLLEQFSGGPDIQSAINAREHPWTTAVAGAAPGLLTLSPSVAGRALIPGIAPRLSGLAERGASAAISGAIEGGQQFVTGEYQPEALATSTAMGALAPRTRGWVNPIEQRASQLAGKVFPHGTAGPEAAAGVAETAPPTVDTPGTEHAAVRAPKPGPENYGKTTPVAAGEATGVNVTPDGVDPTVASTFKAEAPVGAQDFSGRRYEAPPVGAEREFTVPKTLLEGDLQGSPFQRTVAALLRGPEPSIVTPRRPGEPLQAATPEEINARMRAQGVEPEAPRAQPEEAAPAARQTPEQRGEITQRLDQLEGMPRQDRVAHLRETAAMLRAQGVEGRARQFEQAAAGIERSQQQQQQQQQQPGAPPPSAPPPPPAGSVAAAQAAVLGRVAKPPSLLSRIPTTGAELKATAHNFYTAAKDAFHPLEQLSKTGPALTPEQDFYKLARLTQGLPGRVERQLEHDTYDFKTKQTTGKSLKEVLEPVRDDEGFTAYALAKRAQELEGRGIKTGMPIAEVNQVVAAGTARYEPIHRELVDYQGRVLSNLRKSGVISAEVEQRMRALNKEYVPYNRLVDPTSELGGAVGAGQGLQVRDPVRGIKGSEREVLDPISSIVKNTYAFTDVAQRNLAMQALEDWKLKHDPNDKFMRRVKDVHAIEVTPPEINKFMQDHGISGSVADAMTVFRRNMFKPDENKIRVYRDGKSHVYEVADPALAKAVNAMDRDGFDTLTKILQQPAKLLRAGATLSPEFIARNPVRDQFSAFIQSKHGYIPVYDMVRGMGSLFKKDADYLSWLAEGGANATLVGLDRKAIGMNPKDFVSQVKNVIKSPIEALRVASEFMENATRLGEFKRGIEAGVSPTEAAFSSREVSLDFARVGAKARAVNAIVPFFNAQLEGVDRAARAFKDNPTGTLTKVGAAITLPSVALWFANKDDPRYQELPQWQKDLFWIIPTDHWTNISSGDAARVGDAHKRQLPDGNWQRNDGTIYRIPKPFELGILFGSVPERALEAFYRGNPDAFKKLGKTIFEGLTPSYIPQAVTPVIEQFANRSLFLDRSMIPKRLEGLPPKEQFTPQTSETAKTLGNIISGINAKTSFASPIVIDNYIRQYTGGLGSYVVNAMDAILKPKDAPAGPAWSAADVPGLKAFATRFPSAGAQSIQDFYDTYAERKQTKASIDALQKRDPAAAGARRQAEAFAPGDNFNKQISAMHKKVRDVYDDKSMSPQEKRQAIDTTYLQMIEVAKRGNMFFQNTKKQTGGKYAA
jgi:hypothetical protein